MKRRDWFKCFLALPFVSLLKVENKEKLRSYPKTAVNSYETVHARGWQYGVFSNKSFTGDILDHSVDAASSCYYCRRIKHSNGWVTPTVEDYNNRHLYSPENPRPIDT